MISSRILLLSTFLLVTHSVLIVSPATLAVPRWWPPCQATCGNSSQRLYEVMAFSFIFSQRETTSRILQQTVLTTQQLEDSTIPKLINGNGNGNYLYWFKLIKMHFYPRWLILKPEFCGGSFSYLSQTLSCLQLWRMKFP